MTNYLSVINTILLIFGLDVARRDDACLKYYQKAVQMHAPLRVNLMRIIDIPLLKHIIHRCDSTDMGQVFKALYLLIMLVKWSKTMQTNNQVKLITVPKIINSSHCPVVALSNLLSNLHLFQCKVAQTWVPLTDSSVRRHFEVILSTLHLNNVIPHMLSGVQVPCLPLIMMLLCKMFKDMVPERQTASGGISLIQLMLGSRLRICSEINLLLQSTTHTIGVWVTKYSFKILQLN